MIILLFLLSTAYAQEESWRDNMKNLIYSPRYFGPNAFPFPELRNGYLSKNIELEIRGQYSVYEGDEATDIYARFFVPVAKGRAGFEMSYIFYEYYYMTQETADERHAAGRSWKYGAHGDIIISSLYQLLPNNKWVDMLLEASMKTASGNRIYDARYTDAVTYWFDFNAGFNLFKSADSKSHLRLQGFGGFYCWMTNNLSQRQNDAYLYSAGLNGKLKNVTVQADFFGFHGYLNNGDRPFVLRTKLNYEYKKNILSFRFKHGIKDYFYNTFSGAYIRCF